LLEPFDDEAWVYWCIDDYYPIRLDLTPHARDRRGAAPWIRVTSAAGLNVCSKSKKTRIWRNRAVSAGAAIKMHAACDGSRYRGTTRSGSTSSSEAGVLRHLFETIPEPSRGAKEMDGTVLEAAPPAGA
jgi:hypothetical protein